MPCDSCVLPDGPAPALSALESLCLDQIRFWVGVVARNRGRSGRIVEGVPFTRLPAGELAEHLMERFPFLSVTLRQVRRALSRLVELGLVVREQFWQSERWRSDYWYSVPASAAASGVADSVTPEDPVAASSGDDLGSPSLTPLSCSLSDEDRASRVSVSVGVSAVALCEPTASSPTAGDPTALTRGVPAVPPTAPSMGPSAQPSQPSPTISATAGTQAALPSAQVSGPLGSHSGSVWARIRELAAAFNPSQLEAVSPTAVVVRGRVCRIADGDCAPLR